MLSAIKKFLVARRFRSYKWRTVRKRHLASNPVCVVCLRAKDLRVHHIKPFHLYPKLELDPSNLVTLCEGATNCHLVFGHLGDFSAFNPGVLYDAKYWLNRIKQRQYQ